MIILNYFKANIFMYTNQLLILCLGVCVGTTCFSTNPKALMAAELKVGEIVPAFEITDDSGSLWKSTEHVGKKILVVYFYPADMTGGCTKQACAFRDDSSKLSKLGMEVVGVSGDSVSNHQLFKKEHQLNFTLLADTEGKVAELFGVPVTREPKTIKVVVDGKEESLSRNLSAKRWTFVIGLDGKLLAKNTSVAAADDSRAVIETVQASQKSRSAASTTDAK